MQSFSQCHVYVAENVLLDSRLALFHEAEKWLAVADLHFGFELSQWMAGNLVPLWGMQSIEARLFELLHDYQPSQVILLGDLVQDRSGAHAFFSLSARLREQSDLILIAGNHDSEIKRRASKFNHVDLELHDSFATTQFEFHHGDCERKANGRIQIVGHFHPAATLRDGAGLRLKFPAFVQEANCWILPAFSPWAAGTDWEEHERSRVWACTPQRILLIDPE
ncbi:MAG TPA: metallophosphoesterase [Chthoniobacterales bacterium]|nr:metallophosphoesterase [Chthoniobacterales bacterium]